MTSEELVEKERIAKDWLPRYTGFRPEQFGEYILLTNFTGYMNQFTQMFGIERTHDIHMRSATHNNISMINFGIGAPNAVLACDLLATIRPKAILFLGKCGGLHEGHTDIQIGDYVLPTAAIRGEGTSDNYYPPEVPALPSFSIQKAASTALAAHGMRYHSGTVFTTNRRLWEHDNAFRAYLKKLRCIGIEMETAAFFIAAFANDIPHGALLLVSDLPLIAAKTAHSDKSVNAAHTRNHVEIGIETLTELSKVLTVEKE